MEFQAKLNEKYIHVFWYIVFHVLKVLLIKKIQDAALVYQFLYVLLFYITLALTSADTIL